MLESNGLAQRNYCPSDLVVPMGNVQTNANNNDEWGNALLASISIWFAEVAASENYLPQVV